MNQINWPMLLGIPVAFVIICLWPLQVFFILIGLVIYAGLLDVWQNWKASCRASSDEDTSSN